ncbi:MAG: HypC/HybG/HupF family hydrogenase formation chaperone [Bacteroidales bacterium]|nr:HypC/HybG/HupF family hydrogenase formation chaperone [Bacteroidales bacterium]MCF8457669.1 HypC/HybG/HupF family hydrogenase formation chaperone [Bacteroidales bacterium]
MCLSIPAKIISIEGEMAKVELGNNIINASLQLVENAKPGDYVLLHTGFAIELIDEKEAEERLNLLREVYGDIETYDQL